MIILPMAGLSRRFADAGYRQPKYMLPLWGASLLAHCIESFRSYFGQETFLFVCQEDSTIRNFIDSTCQEVGLERFDIASVNGPTRGQAETVILGMISKNVSGDDSLLIFNIDTIRPGLVLPSFVKDSGYDGYLEVFEGLGEGWSFIEPDPSEPNMVLRTAEKVRISNLCSTGLYYFKTAADFREAYEKELAQPSSHELYVAPLYNHLVRDGRKIAYSVIDESQVVFAGTPTEYEAAVLMARPDSDDPSLIKSERSRGSMAQES
ncbi:glycosyltransferase family 2 protein [Mesorhizobium sp.]|uniref:glycosyltransferase family 2 protein n=1 Tax=Mesorhizobium sp. TaxID=1871066 RepID=UPI00257D5BCB|nr:glycosyltransferase family 2 protein [Mesorhizobium sp.]